MDYQSERMNVRGVGRGCLFPISLVFVASGLFLWAVSDPLSILLIGYLGPPLAEPLSWGVSTFGIVLMLLGAFFLIGLAMTRGVPAIHFIEPKRYVEAVLAVSGAIIVAGMFLVDSEKDSLEVLRGTTVVWVPFLLIYPLLTLRPLFLAAWSLMLFWTITLMVSIMTNPSSTAGLGIIPLLIGSYGVLAAASILQFGIYLWKHRKTVLWP